MTHNSLLPAGYILRPGEQENLPFNIALNQSNKRIYFINVTKLYEFTKNATEEFMVDLDTGEIDFESTIVHSDISKRDVSTPMYSSSPRQYYNILINRWIKK